MFCSCLSEIRLSGRVMNELGLDPQLMEWNDGVSLSLSPQGIKQQVPDVLWNVHT